MVHLNSIEVKTTISQTAISLAWFYQPVFQFTNKHIVDWNTGQGSTR
jgi:hypothetical protein